MQDFEFKDFENLLNEPIDKINLKRESCIHCKRPIKVCWCQYLPKSKLNIDTKLTILQHPYEENRRIQTAIILQLAINSDKIAVLKGRNFSATKYPELINGIMNTSVAVLYPSKDAVTMDKIDFKPRHLLILDGTWSQAKGIYLRNKWLHNLPKVMISSSTDEVFQRRSEFVIRTQPNSNCISTVEAVGRALLCLEDKNHFNIESYEALIAPLRFMCQIQLNHGAVCHDPKSVKL